MKKKKQTTEQPVAESTPPVTPTPETPATETPAAAAEPAPETPPAEEPPKKEPTEAEVKAQIEAGKAVIMKKFFGATYEDESEKTKEETTDEPVAEQTDEQEVETPAQPPEKKQEDVAPTPAPKKEDEDVEEEEDEDEAARLDRVSEAAARRAIEMSQKPQETRPAPSTPQEPQLPPGRRHKLEVLQYLESNDPSYKGSGLAAQAQVFWKSEDAYRKKWQDAHPGKRFNQEDEEHNEFYAETGQALVFNQDDFDNAEAALHDQKLQAIEDRHRRELDNVRHEHAVAQQAGEVEAIASTAAAQMVAEIGDEMRDAVTVKGKLVLNESTMAKVEEADPFVGDRLKHHTERVNVLVRELEQLTRFSDKYQPDEKYSVRLTDGSVVQPHAELIQFTIALEDHFVRNPPKGPEGKRFLRQVEFDRQLDQVRKSATDQADRRRKEQEFVSRNWCLTTDDIRHNLVRSAAARVRSEADHFRGLSEKAQAKKAPSGQPAGQTRATPPEPPVNNGQRIRPPAAVTSGTEKVNASKTAPNLTEARDRAVDAAMGW